jgi:hypothetical protein
MADIKRKLPWYLSDFKDALHIQCIASTIFLFLATLTPNVTFGGLLGQATEQYMVSTSRYNFRLRRGKVSRMAEHRNVLCTNGAYVILI